MRRLVIEGSILFLIIVGLGCLIYFSVFQENSNSDSSLTQLQFDFVKTFGTDSRINQIVEPEHQYLVIWENGDTLHATMWIDGIWHELASVNSGAP
jgi:hypothetical protein